MDIKAIVNLKEFFKTIPKCNGSVELITRDGNRLNLRSTLCQYIAMTQMFDDDNNLKWELSLSNPEDFDILKSFIILRDK